MPRITKETPLTGKTKSGKILTEREELFCNLYVLNFKRIESAVEAYDIDLTKPNWRNTASKIAYENLLKPHINERVRELLDEYHMNDETVDLELSIVLRQNADFTNKTKAIDIYNKVTNRYKHHQESGSGTYEVHLTNYADKKVKKGKKN